MSQKRDSLIAALPEQMDKRFNDQTDKLLDLLRGDAKKRDEATNALYKQLSEMNVLLCEATKRDEAATKRDAKERSDIDNLRFQIDAIRDEVRLQGAQLAEIALLCKQGKDGDEKRASEIVQLRTDIMRCELKNFLKSMSRADAIS